MVKKTAYWLSALRMVLLAALVVCACHKSDVAAPQDEPWTPLSGDMPISFTTSLAGETKTTSPLSTSTDFRLFGFYQPGVVDDDPAVDYTGTWADLAIQQWTPNFMYDQEVTYDSGAGKWTYSPVKYWPNNPENTITFWAYSPYYGDEDILHLRENNSPDAYGNTVPGIPEIQFTTDGSRDLLVSDIAQDQSYRGGDPADGAVPLLFHHAMCKVDFAVKKNDPDNNYAIVLKEISLKYLQTTAVLHQSGWGGGWGSGDIDVFDGNATMDRTTRAVYPASGEILPLPQRLKGTGATLHVVYTFKIAGSDSDPVEYVNDVPLGDIHDLWEMEKHYTYNINISPGNPILFTATVEPWGSEQNGYYTVN